GARGQRRRVRFKEAAAANLVDQVVSHQCVFGVGHRILQLQRLVAGYLTRALNTLVVSASRPSPRISVPMSCTLYLRNTFSAASISPCTESPLSSSRSPPSRSSGAASGTSLRRAVTALAVS